MERQEAWNSMLGVAYAKSRIGGPNADKGMVNIDDAGFLFGHGGSGGWGNFAKWYERFDNFNKAFDNLHSAGHKMGDAANGWLDTTIIRLRDDGRIERNVIFKKDLLNYEPAGIRGYLKKK